MFQAWKWIGYNPSRTATAKIQLKVEQERASARFCILNKGVQVLSDNGRESQ
jgi:hypothetical protein